VSSRDHGCERASQDSAAADAVTAHPAEMIEPLSAGELEVLRELGRHWRSAAEPLLERVRDLPVDPSLSRFTGAKRGRFGRFAPVSMFKPEGAHELEATAMATEPPSRLGRGIESLQRIVIGPPLGSSAVVHEKMRKLVALPVLSSDLLSSVAYGPEAMLSVLVLAGSHALRLSLPLAAALVALMLAVGASYRQTIAAYPSGAGSYIVAGDNLGELAGLAAAVGLIADYVLTVAVSVAAGIAAVTSAVPSLNGSVVVLGLVVIVVLLAGNLRGIREAGYLFAAPTYVFLLAIAMLIGVGLVHAAGRGFSAVPPPHVNAVHGLTLLLVLRAFSSGATSMTGIEAASNAVPSFEPPEWKNARTTLTWMMSLLVAMFVGLIVLIHLDGVVPRSNETLLSQLAHTHLGGGALYGFVQGATTLILLFAANTSFNGFPRLLYFMARNQHAPRVFLRMGDRLAFSNGIIVLAVAAAAIFAAFHGRTEALIPLYAVGVFLAVTLSQTGMVVHWWRTRAEYWRRSLVVNGLGALLSALVLGIAAVTKFTAGAWVVVVGIPVLVWLCLRVRAHYDKVGEALMLRSPPGRAAAKRRRVGPDNGRVPVPARDERQETPDQVHHFMVVPVERLDLANLRALAYAVSLEQPLLAVHISPDDEEAERFRRDWETFGVPLRYEVVVSPYRALVAPLAHYVEALHRQRLGLTTTVIMAELVVRHPWQRLLHSQLGLRLRLVLRTQSGIVITTLPFHLPD
jgi:amino acid transporter